MQVCLQGANIGFGAFIQANTGKFIGFFGGMSANGYVSSSSITDGKWHHIVIQNDGGTTYMYVDGVYDGSISETIATGNGSANNKLLFGENTFGNLSFTGSLNDVRIYSRLLENCEIDSLYQNYSGPVAYFCFDSTLTDCSVNSNDLYKQAGSNSYSTFNSITNDYAFDFNGSTRLSSSNIFDNSSFSEMAISMWVKCASPTSSRQICLQGAYIGFGGLIQPTTGKFNGFFGGSSSGGHISTSSITDGDWHHVLFQNDGTTTTMYVDGVYDGSTSETLYNGSGASNNRLYLGQSNAGSDDFTGSLNNIRIYDRTLSDCEVASLAAAGDTVVEMEGESSSLDIKETRTPLSLNVSVFPNPNNGAFSISTNRQNEPLQITVRDMSGRLIETIKYNDPQNNRSLTIEGASGIYFLTVKSRDSIETIKVIKK